MPITQLTPTLKLGFVLCNSPIAIKTTTYAVRSLLSCNNPCIYWLWMVQLVIQVFWEKNNFYLKDAGAMGFQRANLTSAL